MDIVTIDFETYYDTQYSLSKMTTEAYVRDQRFEVIGVGIKVNDYPTDWYSGDNVGRFLKSMPYHDKAILCHNTAFDGAILSWRFGIKPKLWLDTLSMSRPLHASSVGGALKNLAAYYKLGVKGDEVVNALGKQRQHFLPDELSRYAEYCKNDVELTYKLFRRLAKGFPKSELMVIDQTLRMYTEPSLVIDTALLSAHLDAVQVRKANLVESLGLTGFTDEEARQLLMSNDKFAAYLEKMNVAAPMKTSLKTGKQAWAFSKTDKEFTALLDHPNEMVSTAVAARLGVKSTIEESRTKALIGVATRGTLPIMLNYYGAHTGRFSGGDKMNLQNLPRGGALRKSLRAPEGMRLVTCDSAQIEARVVAWLAEQNDLTEAFRQKRDIYSEFASEVYNRKVDRKRKEIDPVTGAVTYPDTVEGFVGKTCILGLGYGMGAIKFQRTLEIGQAGVSVKLHMSEADRIVRLYRQKNHKIVSMWNRSGNVLNDMVCGNNGQLTASIGYTAEGIVLPNKLMIKYPALRRDADGYSYIGDARAFRRLTVQRLSGQATGDIDWVRIYGGKVVENVTQAVARIVVSEQMARIGQRYKVVLQVHDEVVVICPEGEVAECRAFMEEVMSTPPTWASDLPVACESGSGVSYGDAK